MVVVVAFCYCTEKRFFFSLLNRLRNHAVAFVNQNVWTKSWQTSTSIASVSISIVTNHFNAFIIYKSHFSLWSNFAIELSCMLSILKCVIHGPLFYMNFLPFFFLFRLIWFSFCCCWFCLGIHTNTMYKAIHKLIDVFCSVAFLRRFAVSLFIHITQNRLMSSDRDDGKNWIELNFFACDAFLYLLYILFVCLFGFVSLFLYFFFLLLPVCSVLFRRKTRERKVKE